MPVAAGTPLDPELTRCKVLTAAADLFYARGVHAVGVEEIARVAGVSKLSLYRHFGSKDGLVAEVLAARSDSFHSWLQARVECAVVECVADDTPRGRVLAVFDALCEWYAEAGFRGCAIVNGATDTRGDEGENSGAMSGETSAIAQRHLARYQELFEAELDSMGVSDPAGLARQLLLLLEGATVVAAIERSPEAGRYARRAAEILMEHH